MLKILYEDADLVAVDKPSGLLVHPTALAAERESCMSLLRDQLGHWVYPVHRLDRAASGVLLFARSAGAASELAALFRGRRVSKRYVALVRGHTAPGGVIDKPLRKSPAHAEREARTAYERLAIAEVPHPVGRYATARYSLLRVEIETGRLHQIRRHLRHIRHPIVGDTCYGDGKHNRFFRERFGSRRLLLFATRLRFRHPVSGLETVVGAPLPHDFEELLSKVGSTICRQR